eukprot:UN03002
MPPSHKANKQEIDPPYRASHSPMAVPPHFVRCVEQQYGDKFRSVFFATNVVNRKLQIKDIPKVRLEFYRYLCTSRCWGIRRDTELPATLRLFFRTQLTPEEQQQLRKFQKNQIIYSCIKTLLRCIQQHGLEKG